MACSILDWWEATLTKFVQDLLELFTYLVEWKWIEERHFMWGEQDFKPSRGYLGCAISRLTFAGKVRL